MPSHKTTPNNFRMPAVDLEAIADLNRRSVHAMTEMNRRMFHAMLTVQSELLSFTQRRLAEDAATTRRLAACEEPEDAVKIVQGFQARAFEDFAQEAGQLMRLSASVTTDLVKEAQADFSAGAGDESAD